MLRSTPKTTHRTNNTHKTISKLQSTTTTTTTRRKIKQSKLQLQKRNIRSLSTTTTKPKNTNTTTNNNESSQHIAQMMLYPIDIDFISFNERRNTNYRLLAPNLGLRLFPSDNDYTQSIIQTTIPVNGKTFGHLASEITNTFPIKPSFVSFSTTDKDFAKLYFPTEEPYMAYKHQYGKLDKVVQSIESQLTNPNASGIPPIHGMNNVKFKYPYPLKNHFNNPDSIDKGYNRFDLKAVSDQIKTEGPMKTTLKGAFVPQSGKKSTDGTAITQQISSFFKPKMINHPIHPFTPLTDLPQVNGLQCHVSYSMDVIEQNPSLLQHVQKYPHLWNEMYPINNDKNNANNATNNAKKYLTMKYKMTPNGMLEQNFENDSPVSTKVLLALVATYCLTYIGLELYEYNLVSQARMIDPDVDVAKLKSETPLLMSTQNNRMHEVGQLQRERSRLIGQMNFYDYDLKDQPASTFRERLAAFQDGAIELWQVPNPWLRLPSAYVELKQMQFDTAGTNDPNSVITSADLVDNGNNNSSSNNNNNNDNTGK